ncbi:unnamed protein product [Ceutorhynchus assimilis]|uniref:Histone-lysine N-methyltransferase set-23 n=1 Tax=Ceutorhynchus assimilis TaxID=467358 RepID=A0A9N9QRJ4_9CUCU|nr:unnamed protein product [Ceutorhynchus assimilis]
MDCIDDYTHKSLNVMYFSKCIPTKEIQDTIKPSNVFCDCPGICNKESNCSCMRHSGTAYQFGDINDSETYVLSYKNKNRPTYECNDQCQCKNSFCGNKLVQCGPRKGLKVRVCDDERKGEGIFTERLINSGNFVCEYVGEIISEKEASTRFKINAKHKRMNYIFCIDEYFGENNIKTFIDPTVYGNIGRYINHSCDPNCIMVISRIQDNIPVLALFASKDIEIGQEICYDYGIADRSEVLKDDDVDRTKCLCRSSNCRGFLPCDTRII